MTALAASLSCLSLPLCGPAQAQPASYGQELARIATHLQTIGITRVALVFSPDPTGLEGKALAEAALKAQGITLVAVSMVGANGKFVR